MMALAAPPKTAVPPNALDRLGGARRAVRRERELRRQIFRPPPKLTISEWADRHRYLSGLSSAEEGRWRTSRAPFQRGIMDAISEPTVQVVVWVAPSQCGKSEILVNSMGYYIDQDPSPMLMVQPTIELARDFSEDRIKEGLIKTSPRVRRRVRASSGRRDPGNKILRKTFPGGHLTLVGANSATGLASRPIRIVFFDEVDKYPPSAGDKGDPIALATNRTKTFWNRKIVKVTTPSVKGASRIEPDWKASDQRRFFVPCPHCNHEQHLRWAQINFDKVTAVVAGYVCEGCGVIIEERYKISMLDRGQWRATNPTGAFPGFHLNALYSPWTSWSELVAKFLTAKQHAETLKVFVNEDLAEWWDPNDGDAIDEETLKARREAYAAEVPAAVGVLTAFIDVQREWLELLVKGYGARQESWAVAHHRINGSTKEAGVWERLDPLLLKGYQHESGATLHISVAGVDSGDGENIHPVYAFVAPRQKRARCPVFATKGSSVPGRPIIAGRPSKRNKYGVRVFPVGTGTAKDVVFPRLKLTAAADGSLPPGFMHFPRETPEGGFDDEYLAQFAREQVFTRYKKGVPFRVYEVVPQGARNEAIDLEVGCLHMLHTLGAGVFDQLGAWASRVNAEGAKIRARQKDQKGQGENGAPDPAAAAPAPTIAATDDGPEGDAPPATTPTVPRPGPPRPRNGSSWVNRWRR